MRLKNKFIRLLLNHYNRPYKTLLRSNQNRKHNLIRVLRRWKWNKQKKTIKWLSKRWNNSSRRKRRRELPRSSLNRVSRKPMSSWKKSNPFKTTIRKLNSKSTRSKRTPTNLRSLMMIKQSLKWRISSKRRRRPNRWFYLLLISKTIWIKFRA